MLQCLCIGAGSCSAPAVVQGHFGLSCVLLVRRAAITDFGLPAFVCGEGWASRGRPLRGLGRMLRWIVVPAQWDVSVVLMSPGVA